MSDPSALNPLPSVPLGICNDLGTLANTLVPIATSTTKNQGMESLPKNGVSENAVFDHSTVEPRFSSEPSCVSVNKLKDPPPSAAVKLNVAPPGDLIDDSIITASVIHDNANIPIAVSVSAESDTKPIRFKALQDDGKTIDIYAYHRGREGFELRDEQTGELLCDTEPSDTNHAVDDPKSLIANVTIMFPLVQVTECSESCDLQETRYFRESVQWDLTDPQTPNPIVFAAEIAQDFGLSYPQTWDLAESIQSQLHAFVHENCANASPALIGMEEQDKPVSMTPHLYGEVTGFLQEGGSFHPYIPKPKAPPQVQRAGSFTSSRTASATAIQKGGIKRPAKRRHTSDTTRKAEEVFYEQVRTRLREASVREIKEKSSPSDIQEGNEILLYNNHACHLCQQKQPVCGVFACRVTCHAYCVNHLSERLGLIISPPASLHLDFCPVCSLACNCTECIGKLDSTALDFKSKCTEQGVAPESCAFVDLLEHCRKLRVDSGCEKMQLSKGIKGRKRQFGVLDRRRCAPKIPLSEFPREVASGVDLDYGFEADYKTFFTDKGSFFVTSAAAVHGGLDKPSFGEQVQQEDGSVDFCHVCNNVGNLLCCDFCPRAFHSDCISCEVLQQDISEMARWECPCCSKEKDGLSEDNINGSSSLTTICSTYARVTTKKGDLNLLKLLSILHEMLRTLMDYDFGYMFRSPVDCKQIPSYKTIVDKPMDLGTISSNMLKGMYNDDNLENVALAVLKDIELVWHNCFIFNLEGSAVYRMAEVQKRRALSIQKRSFDHHLSEHVREELTNYVNALNKERANFRRLESPARHLKPSSAALSPSRHKIAGSSRTNSSKARPIAVLDPATGMIVKIYTTMLSASNAVNFLLNLRKHESEWESKDIDTLGKLRKVIMLCQEDPSVTLYGFRWLFLDDLRNRKISFVRQSSSRADSDGPTSEMDEESVAGLVEMVDGGISYFFNSIEEALSFPGLPNDISDLRSRLLSLVPGADFAQVAGRMWRRLVLEIGHDNRGSVDVRPSLQSQPGSSESEAVVCDLSYLGGVEIVKEDLVSGKTSLAGFPHVAAAFQDWCRTLDALVVPYLGRRDLDIFLQFYLDGDRNIDGMRWRSVERRNLDVSVVQPTIESSFPVAAATARMSVTWHDTATRTSQSTENSRSSRAIFLESVSAPKTMDQHPNSANSVALDGLSENCKLPPNIPSINDAGESTGRRESSVHSPGNKEATAVG